MYSHSYIRMVNNSAANNIWMLWALWALGLVGLVGEIGIVGGIGSIDHNATTQKKLVHFTRGILPYKKEQSG